MSRLDLIHSRRNVYSRFYENLTGHGLPVSLIIDCQPLLFAAVCENVKVQELLGSLYHGLEARSTCATRSYWLANFGSVCAATGTLQPAASTSSQSIIVVAVRHAGLEIGAALCVACTWQKVSDSLSLPLALACDRKPESTGCQQRDKRAAHDASQPLGRCYWPVRPNLAPPKESTDENDTFFQRKRMRPRRSSRPPSSSAPPVRSSGSSPRTRASSSTRREPRPSSCRA